MEGNTAATPALNGETAEPAVETTPVPAEAPVPSETEPIAVTLEEAIRDDEPKE